MKELDDLEIYDTMELKILSNKITIELLKRKRDYESQNRRGLRKDGKEK